MLSVELICKYVRPSLNILLFILSLVVLRLNGQFYGGENDGFSMFVTEFSTIADQSFYCDGGNQDGFDMFLLSTGSINNQSIYCYGGNNDGFSFSSIVMTVYIDQQFYCSGGNGDGFDLFPVLFSPFNSQYLYCTGGSQDGFDFYDLSGNFYQPEICYNGGNDDGWSSYPLLSEMFARDYCFGGNYDGFDMHLTGMVNINPQGFYCSGGNDDGFDGFVFTSNIQPLIYCLGGNNDGFHFDTTGVQALGYGIWNGGSSNLWTMAANWRNNTVPDSSIRVTIPAGTPFYPLLHQHLSIGSNEGTYQCRRMDILNGGQLITNNNLTVDGLLIVGGTLTFYHRFNNLLQINQNGTLVIKPGGALILEED